jgi:hypothetical protein
MIKVLNLNSALFPSRYQRSYVYEDSPTINVHRHKKFGKCLCGVVELRLAAVELLLPLHPVDVVSLALAAVMPLPPLALPPLTGMRCRSADGATHKIMIMTAPAVLVVGATKSLWVPKPALPHPRRRPVDLQDKLRSLLQKLHLVLSPVYLAPLRNAAVAVAAAEVLHRKKISSA